MASFFGVSSFLNATDDQIASSATFSGTETDLFPGGGVFIAKLPSRYAGMQIAALPDVVRLDLAGSYTLVDEVTIYAIHIYAHYVTTSSSGQVIEQGYREQTYAGSQPDEVLSTGLDGALREQPVDLVEDDEHDGRVPRQLLHVLVVEQRVRVLLGVGHPDEHVAERQHALGLPPVRHLPGVEVGQVEQHEAVE